MTTAADQPARGYRLIMWLAHRQPHILIITVLADIASGLAYAYAGPGVIALGQVVSVTATLVVLAAFGASLRHENALCWRCAANSPLDGPIEATRYGRALRTFHWFRSWWGIGALVLGLALWGIGALVLGLALLFVGPFTGAWNTVAAAPLFALLIVETAAGLRHRPLEPWCPQCQGRRRWDQGGDPEPSPTPTPTGERERV